MKGKNFLLNVLLLFLLFIVSSSAFTNSNKYIDLDNPLNLGDFNKLWIKKCTDIGERSIDTYFNSERLRLDHGNAFIVSDHFKDKGYKCYRMHYLNRLIISGGLKHPRFTYVKTTGLRHKDSFAVYDYISSDLSVDVKIYNTFIGQWVSSRHVIYSIDRNKYAIEIVPDFKNSPAVGYYVSIFTQLEQIQKNTFRKKVLSHPHLNNASYFPEGSRYIFSKKKLSIIDPDNNKIDLFRFDLEGHRVIEGGDLIESKLVFKPLTDNYQMNIASLVNALGNSFDSFNGVYSDDYGIEMEDFIWLRSWINGRGNLSLENKKKILTSNKERLHIWLDRYLKAHRYTLKKGRTYFFPKDLGHYLLFDYYKRDGSPIFTKERKLKLPDK